MLFFILIEVFWLFEYKKYINIKRWIIMGQPNILRNFDEDTFTL